MRKLKDILKMETKQIDWVKLAYLAFAILFAVLWIRGCEGTKPQIVRVKVPELKGNFKPQKPINHPVNIPVFLPKNNKTKIVKIENPIDAKLILENEKLKADFARETDSLKSLLYDRAIQLNNFSTKFEDENLQLNIEGVVQGEVKEVTPSYKIKSKEIKTEVKCKETAFRVLAGAEIGLPRDLSKVPVKGNLMFQNGKGNILSVGYDNNITIWLGYHFSIFNYKK